MKRGGIWYNKKLRGGSRANNNNNNNNNNFIDLIFDMKISAPKQSIYLQMKQSKIKVK